MLEIDIGGKKVQLDFPEIKARFVVTGIVVVFIAVGLLTSFYTVKADEEGVVLRFGRYEKTESPGLHSKPLGR